MYLEALSKMKCRHSSRVWLALLITTMKVVQAVDVCDYDFALLTECLEMYNSCEKALEKAANNTDKQFELQMAFYPPDSQSIPVESVRIKVSAAVNTIPEGICWWDQEFNRKPAFKNSSQCTSYCWSNTEVFQWSANSNVRSHMKLQTLVDNLVYYLTFIQANLCLILEQGTSSISESHLNLELEIEDLPCMPSQEQFDRVLASALTWVKGYAKPPERLVEMLTVQEWELRGLIDKNDMAINEFYYDDYYSNFDEGYSFNSSSAMLLTLWLTIELFVVVIFCTFLRKIVSFINSQTMATTYKYSLYWGTAYTLGMCNAMNISSILFTALLIDPSPLRSQQGTLCALSLFVIQMLLFPLFELCLVAWASKDFTAPTPNLLANVFCCCFWFNPCKCHSRMIHILALINIVWFVQTILVPGAIVAVFFLILQPAQTIGMISLVVSCILCAITFSSVIVYAHKTFRGLATEVCVKSLVLIVALFLIFCIIITTLLLYSELIQNGLGTAGIGGVLVALIPSAALSILGFMMRRKLLGTTGSPLLLQEQQPLARGAQATGDVAIEISDENTPLLGTNR